MQLIHPEAWLLTGVASLEPIAEQVVRSRLNTLVLAGPGAGKTELLAQRAGFLLNTGICPAPRRILAISFKRDAAANLDERVRERCGDRAARFDSCTLDAFAKSLADRFRLALPSEWRPLAGYEVRAHSLNVNQMREWIEAAGAPPGYAPVKIEQLTDVQIKQAFDRFCHGFALPYDDGNVKPLMAYLGRRWWEERLRILEGQPSLTFPMLSRLAALLLSRNPKLLDALRATYAFVLLDEFQDTTAAQYDLIRTAFKGSSAVLTAVGDSKQRIMVWAGAMPEVFDTYQTDFSAECHSLVSNYRSAPELVRMQHVIAQAVEAGTPAATAIKSSLSGSCLLLEFSNPEEEAVRLANLIEQGIRFGGKKARDFCVLVRQRVGEMISPLQAELTIRGIQIRDESQLQDLRAEPVVKFLAAILRLATRVRDAQAWETLTREIVLLYGLDENGDAFRIEQESRRLLLYARSALEKGQEIVTLPAELVAIVGDSVFRSVYRQYGSGSYLKDKVDGLAVVLQEAIASGATAPEAINDFVGVDIIPAMTIHKSKGLEFQTVIFLGLEDSQWWAFASQAGEEKRGFFVAFSRAIERVYFTFSDVRDERWGRRQQQKSKIGDLYTILKLAGVLTVDHRV